MTRDCDFIPAEYHEQRRVRGTVRQRVAGAIGLAGIMLVWFGAHHYRIESAEAMMQDIVAQKKQMDSLAAKKSEMEQARLVLSNLQELMQQLAGGRSLVAVFGELSRRIPDSIVLTGCHLYEPSLSDYTADAERAAEHSTIQSRGRGSRRTRALSPAPNVVASEDLRRGLTLEGVARSIPDVIDFAAALDKSPAFYDVDMDIQEPAMFAGRPAQRFRMTCRIARQAEPPQ